MHNFCYIKGTKKRGNEKEKILKFLDDNCIEVEKIVSEVVSGSVKAENRVRFMELVERMQSGDILIVMDFEDLGRYTSDAIDTFQRLTEGGIRVCIMSLEYFSDWSLIQNTRLYGVVSKLFIEGKRDVAELQHRIKSNSTLTGMRKVQKQGGKCGRPALTSLPEDFVKNYESYTQCGTLSGLTLSQFCDYCNISKSCYYNWVRRLKRNEDVDVAFMHLR